MGLLLLLHPNAPASGGAITGALDVTLASATSSSTATAAVAGSLAKTLDGATCSSAGTVAASGALARTLASATSSSTATAAVAGALAKTLEGATASSAGAVAVAGALVAVLEGVTFSSTGTAEGAPAARVAALVAVLEAATCSSSGAVAAVAALGVVLEAVAFSSTGTAEGPAAARVASLAAVLEHASASSSGTVSVAGALLATLEDATSAGAVWGPFEILADLEPLTELAIRLPLAADLVTPRATAAAELAVVLSDLSSLGVSVEPLTNLAIAMGTRTTLETLKEATMYEQGTDAEIPLVIKRQGALTDPTTLAADVYPPGATEPTTLLYPTAKFTRASLGTFQLVHRLNQPGRWRIVYRATFGTGETAITVVKSAPSIHVTPSPPPA